jgi:hypothetical protein
VTEHAEAGVEAADVYARVCKGFVLGELLQHVRDVGMSVHMVVTEGALATNHALDKQKKHDGMSSCLD